MTELTLNSMTGALSFVAEQMKACGDAKHARQTEELTGKLTEGRLTVALCGHFSAGKSTLVNALCGAELLPSSPIPTSANVVKISGGAKAEAIVAELRDGREVRTDVGINELEAFCKDGEHFTSVEITYPSELLGRTITLLDTPGIDSTDAAHRMATESALHLADVVFYVMDYNHVQSQINFTFAKELKDWGKPLYFIVNQIDKHRESELSFEAYRRSVAEAFRAWHLEPAGILYLSLREPQHPMQEWSKLIALIGALEKNREELCEYSVESTLRHLTEAHLRFMKEQEESKRNSLLVAAGGEEHARQLSSEFTALEQRIASLRDGRETYRIDLRKQLQSILDNANITPAGLRDLARAFLESRKPGFKTGILFAAGKTAAEQEKRLAAFQSELATLLSAAIDWHVKQLLRKEADRSRYDGKKLEEQLKELTWTPDGDWLIKRVKQGAVIGDAYTMTYCQDMAADIKSVYRQNALQMIDHLAASAGEASAAAESIAEAELQALNGKLRAWHEVMELDRRLAAHGEQLKRQLPEFAKKPELPHPAQLMGAEAVGHAKPALSLMRKKDSIVVNRAEQSEDGIESQREFDASRSSESSAGNGVSAIALQREAAQRLLKAAGLMESLESLMSSGESLREKGVRLAECEFTIALFGAFSAGKSSLANALIGEAVLPVSPNPTTAAINRIKPPDADYPHGTARIVMKDREAVLSDLRYSLSLLGEEASADRMPDAVSILKAIDGISIDSIGAGGRPHYSFLRAARLGWEKHEQLLGTTFRVDREEYESYVADETRSCFVSQIDYHHDCELTKQGVVLVDTPGADSVNARHTGVAFNYIKNADAVLFVTYYNHAFSQADRQFLDQLGRVKDQFELDKMFFIVNAADLAGDAEELDGVLSHVEQNLLKHAIRKPRMFPVSSLEALDGKRSKAETLIHQSGIHRFEAEFFSFIRNDLGRLAIESAEQELVRNQSKIGEWIRSAEGDEAARDEELRKLNSAVAEAQGVVEAFQTLEMPQGLKQEANELHYYVLQRLQYRFGEFYHLAFNPASLQDDGRDLKKVVWTAWLELQRLLQLELAQELLATALRMERNLNAALKQAYAGYSERLETMLGGYHAAAFASEKLNEPQEAVSWESSGIESKWLWSRFKSPRAFFEGEGKSLLRKELEAVIFPELQQWMERVTGDWHSHYASCWSDAVSRKAEQLELDMDSFARGMRSSLSDGAELEKLKSLQEQLNHL
ncbi:dynamin family protein [Paenibacillus sp. HB172176]|uniref:dynamin family protein n=1 Tax=Paenibacillus sp. HB172176 TaxID=2493690 RepID=UPI0014394501|nr:dynamin family protein [Paenibacillus sp. HB172176]